MTPTDIKVELMRAGIRQVDLARDYGCSPVVIHQVIHGIKTSRGVQRLVARRLRLKISDLWPEPRRRLAA